MNCRLIALVAALAFAGAAVAQTMLNVVTAGEKHGRLHHRLSGADVRSRKPRGQSRAAAPAQATAGSQKIYEKLSAQQKAGNEPGMSMSP